MTISGFYYAGNWAVFQAALMEVEMPFGGILKCVALTCGVDARGVFPQTGHYWVARKSGVIVDVFSIGFGPVLASWRDKAGTKWQIAAIPLGGYVKMKGDINAVSQAGADAQSMMAALLVPALASLSNCFCRTCCQFLFWQCFCCWCLYSLR